MLRAAKDLVRINDAVEALGVDRASAAKSLARWQQQRWLKRVGPGLYAPIPLDAMGSEQVLDDPWVVIPALYSPGYIGGWTAAEHWDFTEQIFRSVFVFTARAIRARKQIVQGVSFTLRSAQEDAIFGTATIWRGKSTVAISDKHRTIVDLLSDPAAGGGIRHVEWCLMAYLRQSDADPSKLIAYSERLGNGAVFKRLGYLASRHAGFGDLEEACRERLTQGNAKLDPALPSRRLKKSWRLWIPVGWANRN